MAFLVLAGGTAPANAREPDLFERIARWFDRTIGNSNDGVTGSIASPGLNIISTRQRCEPAANGAPDCRRAAEIACRSRGYGTGRSLQTQSEEVCSLPRLSPAGLKPRECRTETHVLRALCQ
jgi:hypothetical protein